MHIKLEFHMHLLVVIPLAFLAVITTSVYNVMIMLRLPFRISLQLILLSVAVTQSAAAPTIMVIPPETSTPEAVQAQLRQIDVLNGEPRHLTLPVGKPVDLALAEGQWELALVSDAYWASPRILTPASDVHLPLWQRTTVKGVFGSHVPRPSELRLKFASADAIDGTDLLQGTAECKSLEQAWTCSVPAARLDLQFGVKGFATEFRWNVDAAAGETVDLGRLDFTPGASVAGHVEAYQSRKFPLEKLEVSLSATNSSPGEKNRRLISKPNPRGFFQFKGVPAGRYVVRAEGAGRVTPPRSVDVVAGLNAMLREPLLAARPSKLAVEIMPMLDAEGRRWLVELYSKNATSAHAELVTQSEASMDGRWAATSVTPGDYAVYVRRTNGSVWKIEELTMPAEDLTLPVLVEGDRIKGTVKLGGRPIAATVQFEGAEKFVADERGQFQGAVRRLPAKTPILITHDTPDVSRHVEVEGVPDAYGARVFDIELPNTTIIGRTIHTDGSPAPFAILNVRGKSAQVVEQPSSGPDGRFQIAGLEPGTYKIQAEGFKTSSAVVDVEATDSPTPTEIDLVLREQEEVQGEVMMGTVRVASADIHALPRYVATSFVPKAKSDPYGRFVLHLPPGTETYDALVVAPGFATVMGRIVRTPKKVLHVETTQTGGTLSVTIPTGAPVTLRREGGEFQLSWISWKAGGTVERLAELDRVTLPNLESGQYELCLSGRCSAVFVPPLATASVALAE